MSKHPRTNSPRSDLVRRRAEKLAALGDLLASSALAPWPSVDVTNERQSGAADARIAPWMADTSAEVAPQETPGDPAMEPTTADAWQRRQTEILSRIDENLRRLRLHQESPRDVTAVFSEPVF
ncbi:MAG: hypothetical protein HYX69_18685 [Planctomycetia bacterium]|nr:hypothetical protein [Planctomycetia bacterium]